MPRPTLLISAGKELFESFFSPQQQRSLSRKFAWNQQESASVTPEFQQMLRKADALITTWDSPSFSDNLPALAPRLRMVAHCGGEVKSRFSRYLFKHLTITNAPAPMARATAELGATLLMYCARNVDSYRAALRQRSNRIYDEVHRHGGSESIVGGEVAMIGFGRIGRALVDMMRGFELQWLVHDPYAPRSLSKHYPIRFVGLPALLPRAHLLVLTAALTELTRGLLGHKNLALLPDDAAIINIARGGLIDLEALRKEVTRGRLRCALDVTDPREPLPVDDSFRKLPGAILTPHIAGSGRQVRAGIASAVIHDLESFFAGKGVQNRVTASMLDRMS